MSLFRCVDVVDGRILIDNVDIATIHPDEIRTRLSIIPQDVVLFSGSIRDNLDPRGHYTEQELWNCLEIAQLKDVISALPSGLETEIIDNGLNFSAGHRQLYVPKLISIKPNFLMFPFKLGFHWHVQC